PEFLLPENTRDRLAVDAPGSEGFEGVRFVRRQLPARCRDETRKVELQCGADQQSRVEFGGFDPGRLETRRQRPPRNVDGLSHSSSPRKRGPITTDAGGVPGCSSHLRNNARLWLRVPARARKRSLGRDDKVALTPPHLARRVARPGARWSARRSARSGFRPRSPAAACKGSG